MPRKLVNHRLVMVESDTLEPDQELVRQVGEVLYGELWQSAMARELGLNVKSVQRWSAGMFRVNPEHWERLRELLHAKRGQLMEAEQAVTRRLAGIS